VPGGTIGEAVHRLFSPAISPGYFAAYIQLRIHFMRILVTGGGGFIGSHLTEFFLQRGDEVVVVDDFSTGSRRNIEHLEANPRLRLICSDLATNGCVQEACHGVDAVYHLAAAVGVALIAKQPTQTIHRNIYPTQLLLDELRRHHLAGKPIPLFLASTSEVYGKNPKPVWNESDDLVFGPTTKPRWSYGASKAIDEFLCMACVREHQMQIIIGRFFNVVGPRQTGAYGMVLPRFVEAAMQGKSLMVHDDGQQTRCFAHVNDVVYAVTQLMQKPNCFGRIYNIGSDSPVSILDVAKQVISIVNPKASVEFQSYTDAYDEDFEDIRRRVPDLGRLKKAIDYTPRYQLSDVIRDVWKDQQRSMP
jgi:UDP-glucose 4-epimerase